MRVSESVTTYLLRFAVPQPDGFKGDFESRGCRTAAAAFNSFNRLMLHHLSFAVTDLARSAAFYDAVLATLGYRRIWDDATFP